MTLIYPRQSIYFAEKQMTPLYIIEKEKTILNDIKN